MNDSDSQQLNIFAPPPVTERALKQEQMEAIRRQCLRCVACGLSQTRTIVVFGEGSLHSPLVIVGEGPGETEDATGHPFVGRAGALLDQALRENSLLRKHVWITNVVKCRACLVQDRTVKNRPPSIVEVQACKNWLSEELRILSPRVILCLGGPAAKWIIRPDFRILSERGRWFPSPWADFAIATLHPAYVLRQEGSPYEEARAMLVNDIAQAKAKAIELRQQSADRPTGSKITSNGADS